MYLIFVFPLGVSFIVPANYIIMAISYSNTRIRRSQPKIANHARWRERRRERGITLPWWKGKTFFFSHFHANPCPVIAGGRTESLSRSKQGGCDSGSPPASCLPRLSSDLAGCDQWRRRICRFHMATRSVEAWKHREISSDGPIIGARQQRVPLEIHGDVRINFFLYIWRCSLWQ